LKGAPGTLPSEQTVTLAQAGVQSFGAFLWIPAFAGMTK
jgi:hypothetical protein